MVEKNTTKPSLFINCKLFFFIKLFIIPMYAYLRALEYLNMSSLDDPILAKNISEAKVKMYNNLAATQLKVNLITFGLRLPQYLDMFSLAFGLGCGDFLSQRLSKT